MDWKSKILKVVILLLLSASRIYAFDTLPTIYSLLTSDKLSVSETQKPANQAFSDLVKEEQNENEEDDNVEASLSHDLQFSFNLSRLLTDQTVSVITHSPFILSKLFIFFANLRI